MKTINSLFFLLLGALCLLSGCQVVEDIFKAGVWVGIIIVVLIIAIIIWILRKIF